LADRQVDPGTGTIRIVPLFPILGNILRSWQYGRVRVEINIKNGALWCLRAPLSISQGSYQVAVVGSDHKLDAYRETGETVGTMW